MSAPADQVAAWDAQAATWARFEHLSERGYARLNDVMVARASVPPGGRVLDVACGIGGLAARFAAEGATAVATDFSPAMVEHARARGLDAHVRDADAALEPGGWDAVVSRMGAFFFPHVERWLGSCLDALRPDGHIVLALWGHPAEVPLIATTDALAKEFFDAPDPPDEGVHRKGGPDPWPNMLRAAGFVDVVTEDVIVATPFGTPDVAVEFLKGLAGDLSRLADADRVAAFWAEVAERLPMRDGVVESRAVVVSGVKPAA